MTIAKGMPMLAQDIIDLKNGLQTNINIVSSSVAALQTTVNGLQAKLPVGTILMYDGTGWTDNSTLPGWYACNAANAAAGRTPDLTNKFVMGSTAKGGTGGNNSVTLITGNLPAHSHSLTGLSLENSGAHTHTLSDLTVDSSGAHSHTVTGTVDSGGAHTHNITDPGHNHGLASSYATNDGSTYNGGNYNAFVVDNNDNADDKIRSDRTLTAKVAGSYTSITINNTNSAHSHTFSSGSAASVSDHTHTLSGGTLSEFAAHTHTISGGTIGNTGSGTAFDNRPSYYALIYIRKCA